MESPLLPSLTASTAPPGDAGSGEGHQGAELGGGRGMGATIVDFDCQLWEGPAGINGISYLSQATRKSLDQSRA